MIKELLKLTDSFYFGTIKSSNKEILCIFDKNTYPGTIITIIEINIDYFRFNHLVSHEQYSRPSIISLFKMNMSTTKTDEFCLIYKFINEIIKEYNIDINNFNSEVSKLIVNIYQNQIFK